MFDSAILRRIAYSTPSLGLMFFLCLCAWGWNYVFDIFLPDPKPAVQAVAVQPTPPTLNSMVPCRQAADFDQFKARLKKLRRSPEAILGIKPAPFAYCKDGSRAYTFCGACEGEGQRGVFEWYALERKR